MKKILSYFLIAVIALTSLSFDKTAAAQESDIVYMDDGCYIETVISEVPQLIRASNTITKKKTLYYKDSSGNVLWSAYIKATFTYDNITAKCTDYSFGHEIVDSKWFISSISATKSGNTATTNVSASRKVTGGLLYTVTRAVTLTCSPTGVVS